MSDKLRPSSNGKLLARISRRRRTYGNRCHRTLMHEPSPKAEDAQSQARPEITLT